MEDETKWLWKMSPTEIFYAPFTSSYRLSIGTRRPLVEEDFNLTLGHLFRKVPSLRACPGERDGEKWLREMPQEVIDFEMTSEGKTDELFARIQKYNFNTTTGPLWCVKVKPAGVGSNEEFPHLYDLFLGINHLITDGVSNVMICGFIVHLLDDVLGGRPVDDSEQLGDYIQDVRPQELIEEQVTLLEADPQRESSIREEYLATQSTQSLFKTTFRGTAEAVPRSVTITRELDSDTTASFFKRCRAEGITVHSGFTAVANIAMVDVLAEGGLVQDSYGIRHDHVMDTRKYMEGDTSRCLGMHLLHLVSVMTETRRESIGDFWGYARLLHKEMVRKLKTDLPLQELAAIRSIPNAFTFEYEYSTSNLGDVTKPLTEGLRDVQVSHLQRGSMLHTSLPNYCHYFHTLSGRLCDNLVVNTRKGSPEIGKKYIDIIFDIFPKVVQQ